jgi:hypothetical protein
MIFLSGCCFLFGVREINLPVKILSGHKFIVSGFFGIFLAFYQIDSRAIFFATSSDQITKSHNLENGVSFHVKANLLMHTFIGKSFLLLLSAVCFASSLFSAADKKGEESDDRRPFPFSFQLLEVEQCDKEEVEK